MSKSTALASIEKELAGFQPEEQERLGQQFANYLRRVKALREALGAGEADIARGKIRTLANLDEAIAVLRRQYAG